MNKYEIFRSEDGKPRVFIVDTHFKCSIGELLKEGTKYFKYSTKKLKVGKVWIVGDELYLDDPHKRGQKVRLAVWRRRKGE